MKKISISIVLFLSLLVLVACGNNSQKQEPIYEGMSIIRVDQPQTTSNSNNISLLSNSSSEKPKGEIIDDKKPLDKDIDDIVTIEVLTDEEVKYYVTKNEEFIVRVHLSNPDEFEIQSFTLNEKKYANYMFEQGSTLELLLLKVTAPSESGYIDLTIDAIKYIDGTEIKDVQMDGSQTIKAGIRFENEPAVLNILSDIGTTTINLDFDIQDIHNLTENNELAIYLSDGTELIEKKDLVVGNNKITFDNLEMGKTYEYGIVAVYDLIDGRELQPNWLLKNTFVTQKAFTFENMASTQTSISFDVLKLGTVGIIKYFNLIDETTNQIVRKIDNIQTREVNNLFSNRFYIIEAVFEYQVNQNTVTDSVKFRIATQDKAEPVVSLINEEITFNSISGNISINDPDNLITITNIELLKDGNIITQGTVLELLYGSLSYYTEYDIKVSYNFDLNDGIGLQNKIKVFNIRTAPYFNFTDVRVLNTTAVSEGDTIILQANIDNPANAIYTKVVVNGQEYNVSPASTQNRLRVEIVNNGQFAGGDTVLSIEEVTATKDNKEYQIAVPINSTATVFVNGNLEFVSIEYVDENFEAIGDYVFPSETIYYGLIKLNNPTGYVLYSIIINGTDVINQLTKIDDNTYYYPVNTNFGWNQLGITSIAYKNQYIDKEIKDLKGVSNRMYKVNSNEIVYISSPNDLLNMHEGNYYELSNDIDLSGINWFGNAFYGVFNGNGYSIKYMSNVASYQNQDLYLGLFSTGAGVIKNLNLIESTIIVDLSSTGTSYSAYYGGLIARANDRVVLDNITIDEHSSVSISNSSGSSTVGGLLGGGLAEIINSYNSGTVSGDSNVGGLLGFGSAEITNSYNSGTVSGDSSVGGLLGGGSAEIINSYNSGDITGRSGYTGGLLGGGSAEITNSYNSGTVSGQYHVGGLIGYKEYSSTSITNSYNSGDITSSGFFAGGLIGSSRDPLAITNSYNSGTVSGQSHVGGLIGNSESEIIITNSYNSGILSGNYVGGLIGYSESEATVINNYVIARLNGYDTSLLTINHLNDINFYLEELLWDVSVWDLTNLDYQNGNHPILRLE